MSDRKRIKNEALIVAYAMARIGKPLLAQFGWQTWNQAFAATSAKLDEKHNSIKLLRDEFDVFVPNGRLGWHKREPHANRLAVLHEFEAVSDEALLALVGQILAGGSAEVEEVMQLVDEPPKRVANVAERLLTGKLAEEHFIRHSQEIIDVPTTALVDMRLRACGYDFEATPLSGVAIEVKGLKETSGGLLFTDREWTEANHRKSDYWLVVVGSLASTPQFEVLRNPASRLKCACSYQTNVAATWRTSYQMFA